VAGRCPRSTDSVAPCASGDVWENLAVKKGFLPSPKRHGTVDKGAGVVWAGFGKIRTTT